MAKSPPSFDFYPNDWLAGTAHMTAESAGAYFRLLCYQWANGHIPKNVAQRMRLCEVLEVDQWEAIWAELRVKFKPIEADSLCDYDADDHEVGEIVLANPRMHRDRQIAVPDYQWEVANKAPKPTREELSEIRRKAGKQGGRGRTKAKQSKTKAKQSKWEVGSRKKEEGSTNKKKRLGYSDAFDTFWAAVPPRLKAGKARAAKHYAEAVKVAGGDEVILAAWVKYVESDKGLGQYAWQPCSWLRDGHYEDDPATWRERPREPKTRSERNMAVLKKLLEDENDGNQGNDNEVLGTVVRGVQQRLLCDND